MSGRVIKLLSKRVLDFSFLSTSAVQTITLRRALPIVPFYYYWVGLRVHNKDIQTGSFTLELPNTLPFSGDPQEFTEGGTPALQIVVNSGTAVPSLLTDTHTNLGPYVKVIVRAAQGTAGNRLYAELSAVLFGRVP